MADSYKKALGGRLKIAGKEVDLKKKKKKRKREDKSGDSAKCVGAEEEVHELKVEMGTGRITSSGMVVTGHGTKFLDELKPNDAIVITHPTTFQEETRMVKVIVSNISMSISSPLSTDLVSTTSFRFIKTPKEEEENPEDLRKRKQLAEENQAFGTYAGDLGTKVVYRVKKPGVYGGYKIVTESQDNQLSRTELLEQRTKHKSDRLA